MTNKLITMTCVQQSYFNTLHALAHYTLGVTAFDCLANILAFRAVLPTAYVEQH